MRSRSSISLVVVLAALGGMLAAVTRDRARSPLRVTVLTYNTHLLPSIGERFASRRGRGDYRARTIGRQVAPHDLVGLCEVFDPRYRQALIDSAQAEAVDAFHVDAFHILWTKKPPGVGFANSGLLLLSRFTMEENHAITYADASRFSTHGFGADAFAHRFIGYLQNHDQLGNRAQGKRSSHLMSKGRLKVGAALVLTAPFVPMLFQGEEWGATAPFQFFTDFENDELATAVRKGRREEFAAFGWAPEEIPDPQDPATFERSKPNWNELTESPHAELLEWHRQLIRLRRAHSSLTDGRPGGGQRVGERAGRVCQ